jgi:hypothetical protein
MAPINQSAGGKNAFAPVEAKCQLCVVMEVFFAKGQIEGIHF